MNILFFLTLFCASLSAEKLLFQEGQEAHYTVSQSVDVKEKIFWLEGNSRVHSKIGFDLELVKIPEGEAEFPFVVSLSIKEIDFTLDSEDLNTDEALATLDSSRNALVGKTLQFQVNGPFAVEELTGAFKEFDDNDLTERDVAFGKFFFEFFFTQLFDRGNAIDMTPMLSFKTDSAIVAGTPPNVEWDEEKMSSNWEGSLSAVNDPESSLSTKEVVKLAVESRTLIEHPLLQERRCHYSFVSYSILHQTKIVGIQEWESF